MKPGAEKDEILLDHIDGCIQDVREWTATGKSGLEDRWNRRAVLRTLHELTESTQRLGSTVGADLYASADRGHTERHQADHPGRQTARASRPTGGAQAAPTGLAGGVGGVATDGGFKGGAVPFDTLNS